jgi:hypothetical protein
MNGNARAKRVIFSLDVLVDLFCEGRHVAPSYVVRNGLPRDAKLVDARFNKTMGGVEMDVVSASFPEVPAGDMLELLDMKVSRV